MCRYVNLDVIPYKDTATGRENVSANWDTTGINVTSAYLCRVVSMVSAGKASSASVKRVGEEFFALNLFVARTAMQQEATVMPQVNANAG